VVDVVVGAEVEELEGGEEVELAGALDGVPGTVWKGTAFWFASL
jgi:hypothetical protein